MKRILLSALVIAVAFIVLPPMWYGIFPEEPLDLPAAGRRISVGGGLEVNAIERGSGWPIVLVHGSPGSAYDWKPTLEALAARGYHVLAYDRVGYGYSDGRQDEAYTVESNARELLALLEKAGLQDATIVGWSYGGSTAMAAALHDSSRIARLVLVGSGGYAENPPTLPPGVQGTMDLMIPWLALVPPAERSLQAAFSQQAFGSSSLPEWWLPQLAANFQRPGTRAAWEEEGATFTWDGPDPGPIDRPILVAHGSEDALVPLAVADWLHERSGNSELWVVEGGGHMLPVTHADSLVDRIVSFIEKRS
jgi:pimeloyl-ACP methyl ester carboxylesterase